MDHNLQISVHQRSSKVDVAKRRDNKKKKQQQLLKVVYISNPVHFKASASEFKGLVQQFTGQDSDVAELSKFAGGGGGCGGCGGADSSVASADWASFSTDDDSAALSPPAAGAALPQQLQQPQEELYKWEGVPAPFDDEDFTLLELEKFAAFMPTSLY